MTAFEGIAYGALIAGGFTVAGVAVTGAFQSRQTRRLVNASEAQRLAERGHDRLERTYLDLLVVLEHFLAAVDRTGPDAPVSTGASLDVPSQAERMKAEVQLETYGSATVHELWKQWWREYTAFLDVVNQLTAIEQSYPEPPSFEAIASVPKLTLSVVEYRNRMHDQHEAIGRQVKEDLTLAPAVDSKVRP